jgi:hypothetical protein
MKLDKNEQPELEVRDVLAFLDSIMPVVDIAERSAALLRRKLGTTFRIAEYSVGGYEVPLNRILGDLLDPRGSHGQGPAFLKLFIEMLKDDFSPGDLENWVVVPSHRTSKGQYVDLALFRPKHVAIYIECKPWAEEGCQQLSDYAEDLLERQEEHKRLLFVPGWAVRDPETLTDDARQHLGDKGFKKCPIQRSGNGCSIVEWLEQCVAGCEAENVRVFINDLSEYLDTEFCDGEGKTAMNDDPIVKMLKEHIKKNRKQLEVTLKLESVATELREDIAQSFFTDLKRELEAGPTTAGWVVFFDPDPFDSSKKYQKLWLKKSAWPDGWGIALEMGQTGFKEFFIGFSCPSLPEHKKYGYSELATNDDRNAIAAAAQDALNAIDRAGRGNRLWPAWSWLPNPSKNWEDASILLLSGLEPMPDGRTATKTFVDWFQILADAVGNIVDEILRHHGRGRSSK